MAQEPESFPMEMPDPPASSAGPNLWGVVLRRKWIIVFGMLVGLGFGYLYFLQCPPVFQADAQVLVIRKQPDVLPVQGISVLSYYEDYLPTHIGLIKSPWIVGRAVKKRQLHTLRSYAALRDPTASIIAALSVNRDSKDGNVSSSNILRLSIRGPIAEECGTVLNAVMESYQDFLGDTYQDVSEKTLHLITEAKDELRADLKEKGDRYLDFRKHSPLLWTGKAGANIHQQRLAQFEDARSTLLVKKADLVGRLKAVENALQNGGSRLALAVIAARSAGGTSTGSGGLASPLDDAIFPLLLQEKMLLEDYGPDYPGVQELRRKIELTKEHYTQRADAIDKANQMAGRDGDGGDGFDPIAFYVESLKQELQESEDIYNSLTEAFERERQAAQALTIDEVQDQTLREDKDRTEQLYKAIIGRLQEVELVKGYGGYTTQTISAAGRGMQVEPNGARIITIAMLVGILGGFALAYLVDLSDKRFRSPEEIRRRLSLPVVGHIPLFSADDEPAAKRSERDPVNAMVCTHHRPQSPESEAYRGVRTSLYFSIRGEGHKVIQITSPVAGDGKSTLAANLALSIAQSGKRILLVDADFRRPCQHKLFGREAKLGLVSVLAGDCTLAEAIQRGDPPGLSLLPAGPHPPNPSELLSSPQFKEIVDQVREQFDFVLIDTPPLLEVTDPCAVAPRVDGVLLTIRVSKNVRPEAERAKEILLTLGSKILGVVVNAVARRTGYGYSYGYTYHYSYGYGQYGYRKAG